MINLILNFDKFITLFLKNFFPHNYFFDLFFSFFSLKGNSIFIWILVIIIALFLEEKKHPGISKKDKQFVIAFISTFLLTTLTVFILQNFFHRLRPITTSFNQFQPFDFAQGKLIPIKCPTSFSFPSGHAATAFAAATVLTFFDKKRRFFYYLVAFLIAYSRLYLGCHYFFDVLGGGVLGIIIGKLILNMMRLKKS